MMDHLKNKFPKPPKSFHNKLVMMLDNLPSVEKRKKVSLKRIIAIATCATMTIGASVYAGSLLAASFSNSAEKPEYTTLPTSGQLKKDIGIDVNLPDKFSNGYKFSNARIINNRDQDDSGNTVRIYLSLECVYKKNDNKLLLNIERGKYQPSDREVFAEEYNDVKIYNLNYFMKFVPMDYVMTEQDEKDNVSEKYIFGLGVDEVGIKEIWQVGFELDKTNYRLMNENATLSQEELLEMAKEIIDKK